MYLGRLAKKVIMGNGWVLVMIIDFRTKEKIQNCCDHWETNYMDLEPTVEYEGKWRV